MPFEKLANDYRDAHGSSWSEKWRKGWLRKLELYAFPTLGKLSADQIDTKHLIKVLQPLWSTKTRTADEVRGQIEQILDAARARGLRNGENPARWRGHLENLLSRHEKKKARKRQHHPALKWQDLPKLMEALHKDSSHVSVAAQLLILTGARSHMVRFACWDEFDLESGRWSLARQNHWKIIPRHPLANDAIELLDYHEGFETIDWELMNTRNYQDSECKSVCMAECLSPSVVLPKDFSRIYVPTNEVEQLCVAKMHEANLKVPISVNSGMFL
ncbi:DarT ssDNA thymidine ADP-ribosyltransferase family protein [Pseudomonas extremaustralis]|uniref:DarT ssDNA thymidine ADP-ribosyltransferase family protein n=1 Tax=Pseudomonas extremaustralis TaxID=359110 RepID=UPI003B8A5FEE